MVVVAWHGGGGYCGTSASATEVYAVRIIQSRGELGGRGAGVGGRGRDASVCIINVRVRVMCNVGWPSRDSALPRFRTSFEIIITGSCMHIYILVYIYVCQYRFFFWLGCWRRV